MCYCMNTEINANDGPINANDEPTPPNDPLTRGPCSFNRVSPSGSHQSKNKPLDTANLMPPIAPNYEPLDIINTENNANNQPINAGNIIFV